jgi:hypothetical protein
MVTSLVSGIDANVNFIHSNSRLQPAVTDTLALMKTATSGRGAAGSAGSVRLAR